MLEAAKNFLDTLEKNEWKYHGVRELEDGRVLACVSFNAAATVVDMHAIFDADGRSVCVRVFKLFFVPIDKRMQIVEQMNDYNRQYRWVKFFIGSENDASVQIDAVITAETSGMIVMELMRRILKIINDTYPGFMHTIWA